MCSADVQSRFEFEWQELTPLIQVQLWEQIDGQSAELTNCAAYVIDALSRLYQASLMYFNARCEIMVVGLKSNGPMAFLQFAKVIRLVVAALAFINYLVK